MTSSISPAEIQSVVVVGGGQAAAQAIQSLRMGKFEGSITLIGAEDALPYQRPPLSKAYMKGELAKERLFFKDDKWYTDQKITLRLGETVQAIDRANQTVTSANGETVSYDALILATGSRPRPLPLPGVELNGVFDLRTLRDVEAMQPHMVAGKKLVIIGAGYIGLEAAAVARQLGLEATVLERAPRVLERVTSPIISSFYEDVHRTEGVDVRTGVTTVAIEGEGHVSGVRLDGDDVVPADIVLVGIGILPNDELAFQAGIECADGIVVDRDARTSDPRVFAAGDCTRRQIVHFDREGRLESVHNAIEQGKQAAAAILGKPRPPEDCPWFWSDQYDLKLQIAGLSSGHDEAIVRGQIAERKFAVFYLKDDRLIAVDAINCPPEFMVSKKLIIAGAKIDPVTLADPGVSMKDIAATALA
ncbi:MAG: FAD-dependent oxidoreductase [Pseudomonadota bacterium]